jgi:hypothetical protein
VDNGLLSDCAQLADRKLMHAIAVKNSLFFINIRFQMSLLKTLRKNFNNGQKYSQLAIGTLKEGYN